MKIQTAWFIEILRKLHRSKKKGGMDSGDHRLDDSYRAKSERKRRSSMKKVSDNERD
jgi:hypothetical protein